MFRNLVDLIRELLPLIRELVELFRELRSEELAKDVSQALNKLEKAKETKDGI